MSDRQAGFCKFPHILFWCNLLFVSLICSGCFATAIVGGTTAVVGATNDQRSLGSQLDDATIASTIDLRLVAEKDLPSRWISSQVVQGQVLLTGYLPTQEQIDRAVYICQHVHGVRSVRSDIRLGKPPTRELVDDSIITINVKRKLFNDKEVSGFTVHVETIDGKVYLQGVVANASQRLRAATLASEVPGVTSVVNILHVQGEK
jgi:hyperosmotically inducible periplasmic protein